MPKCTILVGVPGSGKSTWLSNNRVAWSKTLSTDSIIEEIASQYGLTYNDAFKNLIAFAEQVMWKEAGRFATAKYDLYVDRTNLTAKSRQKVIYALKPYGYEFEAVVFPWPGTEAFPEEEWFRRLESRPGKTIPNHVLASMTNSAEVPTEAEGFSKITFI